MCLRPCRSLPSVCPSAGAASWTVHTIKNGNAGLVFSGDADFCMQSDTSSEIMPLGAHHATGCTGTQDGEGNPCELNAANDGCAAANGADGDCLFRPEQAGGRGYTFIGRQPTVLGGGPSAGLQNTGPADPYQVMANAKSANRYFFLPPSGLHLHDAAASVEWTDLGGTVRERHLSDKRQLSFFRTDCCRNLFPAVFVCLPFLASVHNLTAGTCLLSPFFRTRGFSSTCRRWRTRWTPGTCSRPATRPTPPGAHRSRYPRRHTFGRCRGPWPRPGPQAASSTCSPAGCGSPAA
eukprot:SAG22_NODE_1703_length_3777_cov_2.072866_2_plen_293_part_00